MTMYELLVDIHALNEQLTKFEKKYGLLSETFYEWYIQGNEPEDDAWVLDFSMWAGFYKIKLERERAYNELLQDALQQKDGVARIISQSPALEFA
jgi:hypothetical protein